MWTWEQSTGKMFNLSGEFYCDGYSGSPEGKNNTLMQAVRDVGPIPIGSYTIEAPVDSKVHGPYALALMPDSMNDMFGRSGFMIHGDSLVAPGTASEGCIIIPRSAREAIWESNDHHLQVVEEMS